MAYKILNLYACLGGNRFLWDQVADIEVTAIELDPDLAILYKERFPNDIVIVEDAHQYLIRHYKEFDFIWTSPPCPTHSRARYGNSSNYYTKCEPVYPDLKLYEEIIFLKHYFKGKFCVENVIPYYEPLIPAQKRGRHLYWCNFLLPHILSTRKSNVDMEYSKINDWCQFHNYDFKKYKGEQSAIKIARNLVDYEAGKVILETALNIISTNNTPQLSFF